jgi:hypothetical protein
LAILAARAATIGTGLGATAMDFALGTSAFAAAVDCVVTSRRFPAHLAGSFTIESNRDGRRGWNAGARDRERERERKLPLTSEWGGVGIHGRDCCEGGVRLMETAAEDENMEGLAVGVVGFEKN